MQDYVANHSSGGGGDTSNCLKHEDLYPTYKTGDTYKVPTKAYVDEQLDTKANITETKEIHEYLNPFKDKWVAILTDDYYDCPNFTNNYDYTSESSTSGLGVSQFWWYKLIKKLGARKCKVLVYPTIQYDNTMSSEMWNAMLDESTRSDASLKMFNGQTYYDIDENYTQKIYEGDRWPDIVICALGNNSYWYNTTSKPDADRWGLITRYFNEQIGDLSGSTIIFLPLTSRYSLKSSSWVAPDPTYKASVQGYLPSNLDVPLENIVFDSNDITNITKGDDQYCLFNESGNEKIANMIYEKMIASCLNLGAQFGDVITTTYRAQADPTSTVDKERQVPSVAYMQKYVADHASGGGSTTNCLVKTDLYPTYTQGSSYLVPTKAYLEEYVQANAGGDTSKCLMKADLIPSYIEGASYKVPTQAYVDDKINTKTDIYTFSTWTEMLTIPELTEEQIAAGETALSPYDKVPANSAIVIAEGPEEGVNSFLMKGSNNTCLCFAQSKTDEGFIYTRFLNGADITIENLGAWQKIPFAGEYLTRDIITTAPVGDPIEKATLLSENATLFAINTAMPVLDKKSGEDESKITVPTSAKVAATYSAQGHTHWDLPTSRSGFESDIKDIVLGSKVKRVFSSIFAGIGTVATAIDTGWLIALQSQVSSLYSIVAAQGMVQGTEAASATANTLSGFSSSFSNTSSALSTLAEADADISEATDAITAAINDGTIDLGGSTIENISNSITSLVNTPVATRSLSASKSSSSLPPKLDNPLEFLNYIKIQ